MRTDVNDTCPLGITDETLSALRDDALPADEAARVRRHAEDCSACMERIAAHARVGAALRAQRLPGPDAALWHDVRGAILSRGPAQRALRRWWALGQPNWSGAGPVAAALIVVLLFGLLLQGLLG